MDPLPSSNCVLSMVIKHERQYNLLQNGILSIPSDSNVLFNSSDNCRPYFGRVTKVGFLEGCRSSSTYSNRNSSIKTCTFHGRYDGHTIKTYDVHDYPLGHIQERRDRIAPPPSIVLF